MANRCKLSALVLVLLIMVSCSTGYKAMKKGDYYRAVSDAVETLRKSPRSDKAQHVLAKAYPLAEKTSTREIEKALLLNNQNSYEAVVYHYETMNRLASDIYNTPAANDIIPSPKTYYSELNGAKEKAAAQLYAMAERAFDVGTIEQSRVALKYYRKANQYVYGYRDVLSRIEDAAYESTLRVIVESPKTSRSYQLSADFFSNNLISDISQYLENRLVRFYNAHELSSNSNMRPHQYLVLTFEDFSIGNTYDTKNTEEFKRDSVKIGTATVRGERIDVYNTVKARLTTYRREVRSIGVLSVRIFDAQNRLIQQRNFSGEYVWYTTWANFNGDERALSREQLAACRREPLMPPSHQQMFVEFTKPIYSQALPYLKSHYRKY